MPAKVRKIGEKFRVVETDGSIVTRSGSAVDGGGHNTRAQAQAQAQAINLRQAGVPAPKRRKKKRTSQQRRVTIDPSVSTTLNFSPIFLTFAGIRYLQSLRLLTLHLLT